MIQMSSHSLDFPGGAYFFLGGRSPVQSLALIGRKDATSRQAAGRSKEFIVAHKKPFSGERSRTKCHSRGSRLHISRCFPSPAFFTS